MKLLEFRKGYDEDYSYSECKKGYQEVHILDLEARQNGIWIYFVDQEIYQLAASSTKFKTAKGITLGSSPQAVQRAYAGLKAYRLVGSAVQAEGPADHVFWVDNHSGIAFEFNLQNEKANIWRVLRIYVFSPKDTFYPEVCVQSPQEWKALPPYHLLTKH